MVPEPREHVIPHRPVEPAWVLPVAPQALRLVFQNLLQEQDESALQASRVIWGALLAHTGRQQLVQVLPQPVLQVRNTTVLSFSAQLVSELRVHSKAHASESPP